MTDVLILVVIVGYGVFGYFTGLVRRALGFLAIYLGFFVATSVDPTTAAVTLQAVTWSVSDALIAGYFAFLVVVILVVEILASFYHRQLQIAAVVMDRLSGLVVGAVTGALGVAVALSLLAGAAQPTEGTPDGAQIQIGDAIRKSPLAQVVLKTMGKTATVLFAPAIPAQPGSYFSGQEARNQH